MGLRSRLQTQTPAGGAIDLTALTIESTTTIISGAGYGSNQWYPYDDGKGIYHTRAQYDSHYDSLHTFATAYDYSSTMTTIGGGNRNPSNHYQVTAWINNAGTTAMYSGYTNQDVAANDDHYKWTITAKNSWTGYAFTTFTSTWRDAETSAARTSQSYETFSDDGTKEINSWMKPNYYDDMYIQSRSLSTAYDMNTSSLTSEVTGRSLFGRAASTNYVSGNGYIYAHNDTTKDGLHSLIYEAYYVSSTPTVKYYLGTMTTPWDVSTMTVDTSNYIQPQGSNTYPLYSDNTNFNVGTGEYIGCPKRWNSVLLSSVQCTQFICMHDQCGVRPLSMWTLHR